MALAGGGGLPAPGDVRLAPFYLISTPALRAGLGAATHSSSQTNTSHTSKMKGSMLSKPDQKQAELLARPGETVGSHR